MLKANYEKPEYSEAYRTVTKKRFSGTCSRGKEQSLADTREAFLSMFPDVRAEQQMPVENCRGLGFSSLEDCDVTYYLKNDSIKIDTNLEKETKFADSMSYYYQERETIYLDDRDFYEKIIVKASCNMETGNGEWMKYSFEVTLAYRYVE